MPAPRTQNPARKPPRYQIRSNWLASPLGQQTLCAQQPWDPRTPSQPLFCSPICPVRAIWTRALPSWTPTRPTLLPSPTHHLHRALPPHRAQPPLLHLWKSDRVSPRPPPSLRVRPHGLHGCTVASGQGPPPLRPPPQQSPASLALCAGLQAQPGQSTKRNTPPGLSMSLTAQLPPLHKPANTLGSSPPPGTQ